MPSARITCGLIRSWARACRPAILPGGIGAGPSTAPHRLGRPTSLPGSRHCGTAGGTRRSQRGDAPNDGTNTTALRPQQRDLLAFAEAQATTGGPLQADRSHPSSVTEPAKDHRSRRTDPGAGAVSAGTGGDQPPELTLDLTRERRTPGRAHRRPQHPISTPPPTRHPTRTTSTHTQLLRHHADSPLSSSCRDNQPNPPPP